VAQQYEGSPLLHFHGNNAHFIVGSYFYANNHKRNDRCVLEATMVRRTHHSATFISTLSCHFIIPRFRNAFFRKKKGHTLCVLYRKKIRSGSIRRFHFLQVIRTHVHFIASRVVVKGKLMEKFNKPVSYLGLFMIKMHRRVQRPSRCSGHV